MNVHPTAVIDPEAEIGVDVTIGPYCVIGPAVVLGEGCWLQSHVTLCGPTKIGAGNRFYAYCSIGQQSQDLKYAGEPTYLKIGNENVFREFVTVSRATGKGNVTRIGNHGNFLAYSHIAHDCDVGDRVIFSNNATLGGHVVVEEYAVLGGLTAVHQFCRIGKHAITGGCTKVVQDVPPFMIVDGNPAEVRGVNLVGLERRGFSHDTIRALKEAYRILYRAKLNTKQALEELGRNGLAETSEVNDLMKFIEISQRGIVR
ncbi:MAG TPA: acyl-ACP--UDP-N-acetylglucosamine O-acyltransferase [Chthoniobacterales bacterium]|nr:acyl-ACP--UDP-N-acetylglucosamine O-acyltransferase [Chthoniobacterales bacterium]